MALLSFLMRPLSVSCLLLFGVAPICINPSLWAGSKATGKISAGKDTKQEMLAHEKEEWELFRQVSEQFKSNPEDSLKKASVFLLRWPRSLMADSIRLMAASCASRIERYEQALALCNDVQDTNLKNQTLAQRIHWLYTLGRYQEAYELGLNAPIDSLNAERRAWSRYYMAQSLCQEAQVNQEKAKGLSEKDLFHLEQAYSLYTSAQEIIGYMAVYGRAASAQTLGLTQIAATSYLKAADMPGADSDKCFYLAARLFSDDEPEKAFDLCEKLVSSKGPLSGPAAFLWMKMALKTQRPQEVLKRLDWVKIAYQEDPVGSSYFLASAQADAGQKEEAIETFKKLIPACLSSSNAKADVESYAKPAIVRLADLFTPSHNPRTLVELNESISRKFGRCREYFYACFKAGQLFDAIDSKEEALDQYVRVVVQAPESPWVGPALLRKGLLEADKGFHVASWSSLDLYLRKHATEEGAKQAWPAFLKVTSSLQNNTTSVSFNKERLALVLKRLKEFTASKEDKIQYLSDETERLFQEIPAQAELLLLAMSVHTPDYFTPGQELLMAMCKAKLQNNLDAFVAQAKPAIARESKDQVKLQLRYARCLLAMARDKQENTEKGARLAAEAFYSAFENNPMELSKEDIVWTAQWAQSYLNTRAMEGAWGSYFLDPIYDRTRAVYTVASLNQDQEQWADRASKMLQNLLNRGHADSISRLMLARFQWACGNFKDCSQTLVTLHDVAISSKEEGENIIRPYLAYDCGAHLLCGDIEQALKVAEQLMPLMEKESDASILASFRLTLARACVEAAKAHSPKVASLNKKALSLYQLILDKPCLDAEPSCLEAGVERALLLGHYLPDGAKEELSLNAARHLLELKRHYVEADTNHTKQLHAVFESRPDLQAIWQSYMVLLDALLAQHAAEDLLVHGSSETDQVDAKMNLTLAKNLYQTLLTDKYGVTPFLRNIATKGIEEVKALEQK